MKRRPRVLMVTTNLAGSTSAVAAAGNAWRLITAELGRDVDGLVLAPRATDAVREERIGGLTLRRVGPERPVSSFEDAVRGRQAVRVLAVAGSLWAGAQRAMRDARFDLVHALWALPAGLACTYPRAAAPVLLSCPGSDLHSWGHRRISGALVRSALRRADAVTVHSTDGLEDARALGARSVHSLPNCFDPSTFDLSSSVPDAPVVLYAGRMTRSKGVFVLADALRQVSEDVPCLRFVACGTGPDRDAFEASVRGTLGSRAVFLGPVPPARVAQAMRDARVVVLPSFGEGMSGSVIEALSVGRAVVTTDTGEHAVIVRRGAGGTVVPVGDVRALAGALVSELCRRREPGALHALVDRFTPRAVADRLLELYDLMLGGPFQRERSPVPGTRILAGPLVKGGTP